MHLKVAICTFILNVFLLYNLASSADQKAVLGYYAESLCPDCEDFSNGPLTDAFNEVSIKMIHLIGMYGNLLSTGCIHKKICAIMCNSGTKGIVPYTCM